MAIRRDVKLGIARVFVWTAILLFLCYFAPLFFKYLLATAFAFIIGHLLFESPLFRKLYLPTILGRKTE
jgi:hypothetical protein